jgi:hypothetical protein
MSCEIRNGENFVPQGRHEEQVHFGEHASHLLSHFSPQPIGLHEIDRGKKPRLAE